MASKAEMWMAEGIDAPFKTRHEAEAAERDLRSRRELLAMLEASDRFSYRDLDDIADWMMDNREKLARLLAA